MFSDPTFHPIDFGVVGVVVGGRYQQKQQEINESTINTQHSLQLHILDLFLNENGAHTFGPPEWHFWSFPHCGSQGPG